MARFALARFAAEAGDHGAGPSQVHSSCKIPFGESRNPMSESGHDRNGVSKPLCPVSPGADMVDSRLCVAFVRCLMFRYERLRERGDSTTLDPGRLKTS